MFTWKIRSFEWFKQPLFRLMSLCSFVKINLLFRIMDPLKRKSPLITCTYILSRPNYEKSETLFKTTFHIKMIPLKCLSHWLIQVWDIANIVRDYFVIWMSTDFLKQKSPLFIDIFPLQKIDTKMKEILVEKFKFKVNSWNSWLSHARSQSRQRGESRGSGPLSWILQK